MNSGCTPIKATLDGLSLRSASLVSPPLYVCTGTEEAMRAGGETVLYGFRRLRLAGLPTVGLPDLIVISLAAAATMSAVWHQHFKPLGSRNPRAITCMPINKTERLTFVHMHA